MSLIGKPLRRALGPPIRMGILEGVGREIGVDNWADIRDVVREEVRLRTWFPCCLIRDSLEALTGTEGMGGRLVKAVTWKLRNPMFQDVLGQMRENAAFWAVYGSVGLSMPIGLQQARDLSSLSVAGWFLRPGEEMTTEGVRRMFRWI